MLARLPAGERTAEIAAAMGVTRSTARTRVQTVLTKLGVHSRLEAVVSACPARHPTSRPVRGSVSSFTGHPTRRGCQQGAGHGGNWDRDRSMVGR